MGIFLNADLLSVAVTISASLILGFLVYINDRSSATNRAFFAFAIVTAAWSFFNYVNYKVSDPQLILTLVRIAIFFGVWHAFLFFRFVYIFPDKKVVMPFWISHILLGIAVVVSVLTFTPFVFSGLFELGRNGLVSIPQPGPGISVFLLFTLGLILLGILNLVRKVITAKASEKMQYALMGLGALIMFSLIVVFNVIYPAILLDVRFVPLGALFVLPFIAFTSYTIYRYRLFNLRIIATAFLCFMLTVFSFVNIVYSEAPSAIALNITAFLVILFGSIQVLRDTLNLEQINIRQENLLHFVSHDVKAHLTNSLYAFAAIIEGDFGPVSPALASMAEGALSDMRGGMATVIDILDAANLKSGAMTYNKKSFDLKKAVLRILQQLQSLAAKNNLVLDHMIGTESFMFTGDEGQISQHVIRNILDNAIKYTPSGTVHIDLVRRGDTIRFSVKDNGIGIIPEDMSRLFTEGGKGKDSSKINIHSTGYGLFLAKMVVDAHGGKIWAESEGTGKGARFVVEFPIAS